MAFAIPDTDAGNVAVFCQLPQVARGNSEGEGGLARPEGQGGGIVESWHEWLLVFAFKVSRQTAESGTPYRRAAGSRIPQPRF